jgi:excisionase family DNA binding protein
MSTAVHPSPFLTVAEAAAQLAVSEKTVRRLIARDELPAKRVGTAIRIDRAEIGRLPSVSESMGGPPRGQQLRADADPAERGETPEPLGQSNSPAHAGQQR